VDVGHLRLSEFSDADGKTWIHTRSSAFGAARLSASLGIIMVES